jgi:hypothetical protein
LGRMKVADEMGQIEKKMRCCIAKQSLEWNPWKNDFLDGEKKKD